MPAVERVLAQMIIGHMLETGKTRIVVAPGFYEKANDFVLFFNEGGEEEDSYMELMTEEEGRKRSEEISRKIERLVTNNTEDAR